MRSEHSIISSPRNPKPVSWHQAWREVGGDSQGTWGMPEMQWLPMALFAYFHCLRLLLVTAGEEAADGLLGQSRSLLPGRAEAGRGAALGGPGLPP